METVQVYFLQWDSAQDKGELGPRPRAMMMETLEGKIAQALLALFLGPNEEERALGFTSEIPKGTRLHSLQIRNKLAYVDLSGEATSGGGSTSMLGRLYQIIYTVTQFAGVDGIHILIDGQPREIMGGEGLIIRGPLRRPQASPKF